MVESPPTMGETWVWSLGREDPLEKGMATHSSILAWRIPWTEESGRLQSMGSQRVRHDWATKCTHTHHVNRTYNSLPEKEFFYSYNSVNNYKSAVNAPRSLSQCGTPTLSRTFLETSFLMVPGWEYCVSLYPQNFSFTPWKQIQMRTRQRSLAKFFF